MWTEPRSAPPSSSRAAPTARSSTPSPSKIADGDHRPPEVVVGAQGGDEAATGVGDLLLGPDRRGRGNDHVGVEVVGLAITVDVEGIPRVAITVGVGVLGRRCRAVAIVVGVEVVGKWCRRRCPARGWSPGRCRCRCSHLLRSRGGRRRRCRHRRRLPSGSARTRLPGRVPPSSSRGGGDREIDDSVTVEIAEACDRVAETVTIVEGTAEALRPPR